MNCLKIYYFDIMEIYAYTGIIRNDISYVIGSCKGSLVWFDHFAGRWRDLGESGRVEHGQQVTYAVTTGRHYIH